jgi:hypothetical protein
MQDKDISQSNGDQFTYYITNILKRDVNLPLIKYF